MSCIKCPKCGSGDVALELDNPIRFRFADGKLQAIDTTGVFEMSFHTMVCHACVSGPYDITDHFDERAQAEMRATLPASLVNDLDAILPIWSAAG